MAISFVAHCLSASTSTMDIPDLWEQAKTLLREDTDSRDWQLFTSYHSDASPKEVLESIKKGQESAQDRYKTHSIIIMSKKFEFHVGDYGLR